ncbi:MAG: zinc ribbon domain-containing protein [Candidatus Thorarchaeota archaeon]
MAYREWYRTDKVWVFATLILFILAFMAHIWIQLTGGYSPGSYFDMVPHFLFGAAICALLLNFNINRTWKKVFPIIPPFLLVILPALLYTLAVAFAWEIVEELLSIYLPWLGFYSDFWWNGVRDLVMGLLGALLASGFYLWHFPVIVQQQAVLEKTIPRSQSPGYIPGKGAMNYCDACGATLPFGANHCPNCGQKH